MTATVVDRPTPPRETKSQRFNTRIRVIFALVLAAALLLTAYGAGYAKGGAGSTTAPAPLPTAPPSPALIPPAPGATRMEGTVPVGYSRDERGATAAATNFLMIAYGNPAILGPDSDKIIDTLAAPGQADALRAKLAPGIAAARNSLGITPDGKSTAKSPTAYRLAPIGEHVVSLSPDTAQVSVWWVGLIGLTDPTTDFPVTNVWGTDTITLRWAAGDWKLDGAAHKDGPAPVSAADPSTADEIARALADQRPYTYGG